MAYTNSPLGVSSETNHAASKAAQSLTPPTALKQLTNLVMELQDPRLRRVLQTVLADVHLQGDILAAHFASHRDPVIVEPEDPFMIRSSQTDTNGELVHLGRRFVNYIEFEADPSNPFVACPNIAQLQLVARLARDTGVTHTPEREMLYVAAVLHGLVVIGVRHQGLNLDQAMDAMRVSVRKALGTLEDDSPVIGRYLRLALGLGKDEDQETPEGRRYVNLVWNAWQRSDRTVAWRRHALGQAQSKSANASNGFKSGGEAGTPLSVENLVGSGSQAGLSTQTDRRSIANQVSTQRVPLARVKVGWSMEDRYGSGRLRDVDVQVKAEVMAYLQANPEVVRKAYGLL